MPEQDAPNPANPSNPLPVAPQPEQIISPTKQPSTPAPVSGASPTIDVSALPSPASPLGAVSSQAVSPASVQPLSPNAAPSQPTMPTPPAPGPASMATPAAPASTGTSPVQPAASTFQPPPAPLAPAVSSQPAALPDPAKKSSKKLFWLGGLAGLIVALIAGGYYLFAYLPNTPENVWRRGLASVGVGLEDLAESDAISSNTKISGSLTMTKPLAMSMSIDGHSTEDGEGVIAIDSDIDGLDLGLEARMLTTEAYPQAYIMLSGVSQLANSFGLGGFADGIDGQWWLLDYNELLSSGLLTQEEIEESLEQSMTRQDYQAVIQAVLGALNTHLFTKNVDDMAIRYTDVLGDEVYEGVGSQKYRVEFDQANLEKFYLQLRNNLDATGVWEKTGLGDSLLGQWSDEDIAAMAAEDAGAVDEMYAWVAKDSKVLRNLRFVQPDTDGDVFVDVSLLLEDGADSEELPLRIRLEGDDEQAAGFMQASLALNTVSGNIRFGIETDFDDKTGGQDIVMKMDMTMTPLAETPAIQIPENSQSLMQLVVGQYNATQVAVADTQSKVDINSMFVQLEQYYSENGFYPERFTAATFPGADPEAFVDAYGSPIEFSVVLDGGAGGPPEASDYVPIALDGSTYRYYAYGCVAGECGAYTLVAQLEEDDAFGGNIHRKDSLNGLTSGSAI